MRRFATILAAASAALAFAPAAFASTYTVDDPGDPAVTPDVVPGDDHCDTDAGTLGDQCTLRAAIQEANAHLGTDTISFAGAGRAPLPQLGFRGTDAAAPECCAVTGPTTIDGAGATTITFAPAATGPLISVTAADTALRGLTVTGGASGPALSLAGARDRLDTVTVKGVFGNAVESTAADQRLDTVTIANPGGNGLYLIGPRAGVFGAEVSGAGGDGVAVGADGVIVSGGRVHHNAGAGVSVNSLGTVVSRVILFANGGRPIALLGSGANGGLGPPQDARIGPRRADGSLPLTGSTLTGGAIELFHGDPFTGNPPSFLDVFSVEPGGFAHAFSPEPPSGDTFALTLTHNGTSEFTTVTVPADVSSPDIVKARALSTTEVRVIASEPLDPGSVQPEDFTLTMAGQDRAVTSAAAAPDGSQITLTSAGWKAGEAGYVTLNAAGVVSDAVGNASLATTRLRVAAAPGDFVSPIGAELSVSPKSMCLTRGRGCRRPGMTISFLTTEAGKVAVVIQRGDKRIGSRVYTVEEGPNTLKFNGRLGGRKLRAGRYRLLVYPQDLVGNVTGEPPITLFTVRRVTK